MRKQQSMMMGNMVDNIIINHNAIHEANHGQEEQMRGLKVK